MTEDERPLQPASSPEVIDALSFAFRYDGRRLARSAEEFMARITAERLVAHLERSGFVVMKRPQRPSHSTHGLGQGS